MRDNLAGAIWRFAIFVVVCVLGHVRDLRDLRADCGSRRRTSTAPSSANVTGLKSGDFVRIAGVEVGKVKHISIRPDTIVTVEFTADHSVVLTQGSRAVIRWDNPLGDRYLELQEGAGEHQAARCPARPSRSASTAPSVDLDALIGGFRPLFRALDPKQVNALTGQLIQAFQGQGATISSFLAQTAQFTSTLADRDDLIGQVIHNLNIVLGSLADQNTQFDKAGDLRVRARQGPFGPPGRHHHRDRLHRCRSRLRRRPAGPGPTAAAGHRRADRSGRIAGHGRPRISRQSTGDACLTPTAPSPGRACTATSSASTCATCSSSSTAKADNRFTSKSPARAAGGAHRSEALLRTQPGDRRRDRRRRRGSAARRRAAVQEACRSSTTAGPTRRTSPRRAG